MHILFANTGVQVVCVPLRGGSRYNVQQVGSGWQRTVCNPFAGTPEAEDPRAIRPYPFIQWQIIQGANSTKLFFAIDTTCGDPEIGYFCDASALTGDYIIELKGLLDISGVPMKGIPETQVCIRPATATSGEPKQVHMVIDFGNSRTGALLLEVIGEVSQTPQMIPFELTNRYHLKQYNDEGEYVRSPEDRWFSSKTHWSAAPYLPPIKQKKIQFHTEEAAQPQKRGWFGFGSSQPRQTKVEVTVMPELFQDLSQVRMGREVDDLLQVITPDGDIRTGLSSPKRYLWAGDASWLEGANWHMCDPHNTCGTNVYCDTLHGPLMRFIHENDNDFLLKEGGPQERDFATDMPLKPRHAPRSMMTAAIYELLCQAYSYVNSMPYRNASGDAGRAREIRTLSMTYPSGMISEEKERLRMQVQKAIEIFVRTLGRFQRVKPLLNLSIDEASACHLTYIWSELGLLGQDPRIWFSTVHQDRGEVVEAPVAEENMLQMGAAAGRRRGAGVARPGGKKDEPEEIGNKKNEIRIACIDIGGGTTDLMIASYNYESKIDDLIHGKTLHQDGISLGGDQMVKRLLETIIIPQFAEALNLEDEDVQLLFGPEVPRNREFRGHRIAWMNRLFIPLSNAYLAKAVDFDYTEPISHTDPELIDPSILDSLQQVFDKLRGPGYYTVEQELDLKVNRLEFEGVVHDVFDELLFDMCQRCIDYKADVVLLAGQPTKLDYIQKLVRMYLPLSPSRIVPMFGHYAGNWYPYQDEKGMEPGVIIDPKSPVVVGAALEFMAANGMLPQFKYKMVAKQHDNSYFWGVMGGATSGIRKERILFAPAEESAREEITEFTTSSQRVIIGRKMNENEDAQATPIYLLKMEVGDRIGRTEVQIKIKRVKATDEAEEHLEVDSVMGMVAGQDAVLGENVFFNWRTLADERYYLDTGGLDNIENR